MFNKLYYRMCTASYKIHEPPTVPKRKVLMHLKMSKTVWINKEKKIHKYHLVCLHIKYL